MPGTCEGALGKTLAPDAIESDRKSHKLIIEIERFEDQETRGGYRYSGEHRHFTLDGRRATARIYDVEPQTACVVAFDRRPSLLFRLVKLLIPEALPYGDPLLAAMAAHLVAETPVQHIHMLTRAGYVPLDFARAVEFR